MTTRTKATLPGAASRASAQPDPTPDASPGTTSSAVVTLRKALVLSALVALLVGVLSAAGGTYLAGGRAGELDGTVDTLTAQVDSLVAQAGTLTAEVDALVAQTDSLVAEKADLTTAVADARSQVDSLGEENAALRSQVAGLAPQEPVDAEVTFGKASRANSAYLPKKGSFVLVVNVTVTNPAAEDALFSKEDVLLKGRDDTRYPPLEQSPISSLEQRAQLPSLLLAPSERVRGRLVFYVPKPVTEFTITYHGTTTALSL
jgi:outer membrane murein-binding lipoprotein Lpp